ncbi:MAG: hypothetical protein FJY97_03485 [candidate division Zixibacteria bacterium]|nr:hypothetical protein [candidate division Zixibacteria bacterium]
MSPLVDIVTIGTELILGRVADVNAAWLAGRVVAVGGRVRRIVTVRDDPADIVAAVSSAAARGATHIITTGGLGPTPDDLTVETVARMMGRGVVVDEGLVTHFRHKLRLAEDAEIGPAMRKVATVPVRAAAGPNLAGWGHCITADYSGITLFILPGPPKEVEGLFPLYIEPVLRGGGA